MKTNEVVTVNHNEKIMTVTQTYQLFIHKDTFRAIENVVCLRMGIPNHEDDMISYLKTCDFKVGFIKELRYSIRFINKTELNFSTAKTMTENYFEWRMKQNSK